MDNRSAGIVATLIAVVLCGCPGLFGVCLGIFVAALSFVPGADIDIFGSSDPAAALTAGVIMFVFGLVFVAIPIAVWLYVRRNQPAAVATVPGQAAPPPPVPSRPVEPVEPAAPSEAFQPAEAQAPRPEPESETRSTGAQVFPLEAPPEQQDREEEPREEDSASDEGIPPAI